MTELLRDKNIGGASRFSLRRRCPLLPARASSYGNILNAMMVRAVVVGMSGKCEVKNGKAGNQPDPPGEHRHQHHPKGGRSAMATAVSSAHAGGAMRYATGLLRTSADDGFERVDRIEARASRNAKRSTSVKANGANSNQIVLSRCVGTNCSV